jgi:hypothetical protein
MKADIEKAMRDAQAEGKVPEGDFVVTEEGGECWVRARVSYPGRSLTKSEKDDVYEAMRPVVDGMNEEMFMSTATFHLEVD